MQLRTVKKPKIKDFDFGNNGGNELTSTRKNSHSKEAGEKEIQESSNEVRLKFFLLEFESNK
jgi:hypothetical protein